MKLGWSSDSFRPIGKSTLTVVAYTTISSLIGCHSAYVEATVKNQTTGSITSIEVDYPSASFGKEVLSPGASFLYRFKVLGDGGTKVTWTDERKQEHSIAGPQLQEGQEGRLTVTLTDQAATWDTRLHVSR